MKAKFKDKMEGAKGGAYKHIVLCKLNDGVPPEKIDYFIKQFANLVNLIEPMKDFHWGENVGLEIYRQGYTHVLESTFDSKEAIEEYNNHPAHHEFGNEILPYMEKFLVIDYKPEKVNL